MKLSAANQLLISAVSPVARASGPSLSTSMSSSSTSPEEVGHHSVDDALDITIIIFSAIPVYNGRELSIYLPSTFHRYRSLCFWSMMTSAIFGVIPASIGGVLQFFSRQPL
ncbi:hypothetical protein AARAC_003113 [Aspergillus arachidicola]|uniref:Uncharacterized protein n=1 Tax=Aspergillus arachidicola TaxID=656916 RepID=A0A2G7FQK5_9EURO|nr:hypothetical protein AARAC_003113 [Aspergillus arachidicola]